MHQLRIRQVQNSGGNTKQTDLASAYVLCHLISLGPVFESSMELEPWEGIRQVGEQRSGVFRTRVGSSQRS